MVFSINPTAEKSQAIFKQMAMQQNGTDAGNASMSMSMSSSTTAVATPSAATTTESQIQSSTTVVSPDVAKASDGVNLVQGQGGDNGGQCSCTCLCGAESFPSGMGQGHWGGWGGKLRHLSLFLCTGG